MKSKLIGWMAELSFYNKSDFDLKIACLGPLLVCFLEEIWSDKSLILRCLGLIFCLAALRCSRGCSTITSVTDKESLQKKKKKCKLFPKGRGGGQPQSFFFCVTKRGPFLVLPSFEFLSFVTCWICMLGLVSLSLWVMSHLEFFFSLVTFSVFEFCHVLSFFPPFFSFVAFWVCEFCHISVFDFSLI